MHIILSCVLQLIVIRFQGELNACVEHKLYLKRNRNTRLKQMLEKF
jgi:hypothetical protein